ncbi:MAG TPA: glycine cleavage system aminomethyltransferase GcvT [Alphaproteobacteria bacterium]|nr:glycine cleavage system aminomethyltransferase GcvT [Alphaproteobacteria bacterium]
MSENETLRTTTLHDWHVKHGAKMVPFAGYNMPVQYKDGIIAEHNHTRTEAGLFDVSHMGQVILHGQENWQKFANLVPGSVMGLQPWRMRYTTLLNDWGGVIDDLMMIRPDAGDDLWLVINASRKEVDVDVMRKTIPAEACEVLQRDLLALQGPQAVKVLRRYAPTCAELSFMQAGWADIKGIRVMLMRSGYTGEDGFEISVEPSRTEELADLLLENPEVKPIGLGARDTLRLEAGLCLYGHELDEKTTPVEAGLNWIINRERLAKDDFLGASILEAEILNKPERCRVGFNIEGRAPAREGTEIQNKEGQTIGTITSGGFSPTLNRPIAMGYVERRYAEPETEVNLIVRGKPVAARVCPLPFVTHRYANKKKAA